MTTLQKLIDRLKDEKSKAMREREDFYNKENLAKERVMAFDLAITQAELLLKTESENGGKKDGANDGKPM